MVLQGFQSVYKPKRTGTVSFAELLDAVASVDPEMRIRFTSPHPKEFSDEVLQVSPRPRPIDDALHCCQATAAQTETLKAGLSLQTNLHTSTSASYQQLASLGISIIDQAVHQVTVTHNIPALAVFPFCLLLLGMNPWRRHCVHLHCCSSSLTAQIQVWYST